MESLHRRKDLNWLQADTWKGAARGISGLQILERSRWVMRKLFVFADMVRLAPRDAVVVLVDAGDVTAQLTPAAFAAAWRRRELAGARGVVHGADYGCYPFDPPNAANTFGCGAAWRRSYAFAPRVASPCALLRHNRAPNGGLLAGRAADLAAYFDSIARFVVAAPRVCLVPGSEQAIVTLHYLAALRRLRCGGCAAAGGCPNISVDLGDALFACVLVGESGAAATRRTLRRYTRTGGPGSAFSTHAAAAAPPAL
eukprot:gene16456-15583_t